MLAAHDITGLYQLLKDTGLTQRDIAALTGQSQSEVSEILTGRQVLSYDLLVRITEGLAIPRELMGISDLLVGPRGHPRRTRRRLPWRGHGHRPRKGC